MMSKSTSSSDMGDGSQKEGKMDKPAPFPRPQSADFEFYSKWSFPFFEKFRDYSKNPVENPGLIILEGVHERLPLHLHATGHSGQVTLSSITINSNVGSV